MKNLWDKIRYGLLPAVKMKLKFWWYSIRYGGKENIPPDVIFGEMTKSMEKLQENLTKALKNVPDDMSDDDKAKLLTTLQTVAEMDQGLEEAEKEAKEKFENRQDD